jgi:hypothetical protein
LHGADNVVGHGIVVGLGNRPNRQYASELAERGYVTLAPNYPLLAAIGWISRRSAGRAARSRRAGCQLKLGLERFGGSGVILRGSSDDTDARKSTVRRFGRSHRREQRAGQQRHWSLLPRAMTSRPIGR